MHAWDQDGPKDPAAQPLTVRDLRDGEEESLRHLWRELMDLHVHLDPRFALAEDADQAFLSYLHTARSRDDYRVRVAARGNQLLGFSICCILPNSPVYRARWIGYINDLCVTAAARGTGIGRMLVEDATAWLRQNGADSVEVYVASHNDNAQRFWRRVGGRDYLNRLSMDVSEHDDG